jgi:thioester reductase-like protein
VLDVSVEGVTELARICLMPKKQYAVYVSSSMVLAYLICEGFHTPSEHGQSECRHEGASGAAVCLCVDA